MFSVRDAEKVVATLRRLRSLVVSEKSSGVARLSDSARSSCAACYEEVLRRIFPPIVSGRTFFISFKGRFRGIFVDCKEVSEKNEKGSLK
ncbi:MAG: hypothetical protein KIH01_07200 [Candidatus Freyarchaeota archaeon]|nr:hypothetical protein [Candidatus Jordarchaeia archaeon]